MDKNELIEQLSKKSGFGQDEVTKIFDCFIDSIKEGLSKGEKVTIAGFGTFSLSNRKGQTFLNPKNKKVYEIPQRAYPRFKAGKNLKKSLLDS